MAAEITPFMRRAYQFFLDKGYSPHAAATMAGHGQWESSGSSTIQDPRGEGSLGLYQWRLDRRTGLNDFAKARGLDPLAENTQLQFADWELSNTERGAGDQLRSAKDLDQANAALMNFLRPAGWTSSNPQGGHAWSNRYALSQSLLGDGRGEAVAPVQVAQAGAQPDSSVTSFPQAMPMEPSRDFLQQDQNTPSIWDILQRDGRKLAAMDMGPSQQMDAPAPPASPVSTPQPRTAQPRASLVDLVFGARKRALI